HERLHQHLTDDPDEITAKGEPDGDLPLTALGADQQQVGHVHASDEQHQPHRSLNREHRRLDVPDDLLVERLHTDLEARLGVVRKMGAELLGDPIHLRLGLLNGHPGLEPADDPQGRELQFLHYPALRGLDLVGRLPDVDLGRDPYVRRHVEPETRRQHADDGERLSVEPNSAADHPGLATEIPMPEFVAEDERARWLPGSELAAENRSDTDHREEVARHPAYLDLRRLVTTGQVLADRAQRCKAGEGPSLALILPEVSAGVADLRNVLVAPLRPENGEALRLRVRQRAQQDAVDRAEDRNV